MKKILLLVVIVLTTFQIKAQTQEFGIAAHAGYLTEIDAIGAGVDLNYDFTEKWGVALSSVFAVTEETGIRNKWFAVDINGRYYIVDKLYAFTGGQYLASTVKTLGLGGGSINSESTTKTSDFGINLGTGYRYNLVDNVNLFAEVKYVVIETGYVHAKAGVHFSF